MDIRIPIGGLLALVGLMLVGHSFTLTEQDLAKSLGLNLNLYWGAALAVVGAVFLLAAQRARGRGKSKT